MVWVTIIIEWVLVHCYALAGNGSQGRSDEVDIQVSVEELNILPPRFMLPLKYVELIRVAIGSD